MLLITSTKGMYKIPKFREDCRIANWVGKCIFSTPWFIVMLIK